MSKAKVLEDFVEESGIDIGYYVVFDDSDYMPDAGPGGAFFCLTEEKAREMIEKAHPGGEWDNEGEYSSGVPYQDYNLSWYIPIRLWNNKEVIEHASNNT